MRTEILQRLQGEQDTEVYSHCWKESIQELGQQPKREGGQQEVERGEEQASRMRHALSQAVIHLHTDYDDLGQYGRRHSMLFNALIPSVFTNITLDAEALTLDEEVDN